MRHHVLGVSLAALPRKMVAVDASKSAITTLVSSFTIFVRRRTVYRLTHKAMRQKVFSVDF
jgi:hypothetical protein